MHLQALACGLEKAFVQCWSNPWPGMVVLGFVVLFWTQSVCRPLLWLCGVMIIAGSVVCLALWAGDYFPQWRNTG